MPYNPFDKPIGDQLAPEDLECLLNHQVGESYYIEYKAQFPEPRDKKIPKSIASFANTYGGWYIVGVETDKHNIASAIPGFSPDSCPDPICVVRDLSKHHIDPAPIILPQVVTLPTGNIVLLVYIPDNQDAPLITKDGRIYRRSFDSSDPIPETDRYALDNIYKKNKLLKEEFRKFSKDNRVFDRFDSTSWVNLYISPYPLYSIYREELTSTSEMSSLLEKSKSQLPISFPEPIGITGNVPYNAIFPSYDSVIFRQTSIDKEAFHSLNLELDVFGRTKLLIPIHTVQLKDWNTIALQSKAARKIFFDRYTAQNNELKIFDIGTLWLTVANMISFYLNWLGNPAPMTGFLTTIELKNVWRCLPFCDLDLWGEHISNYGLPVMLFDKIRLPKSRSALFYDINSNLWINICRDISMAFGLPAHFFAESLFPIIGNAVDKSTTIP